MNHVVCHLCAAVTPSAFIWAHQLCKVDSLRCANDRLSKSSTRASIDQYGLSIVFPPQEGISIPCLSWRFESIKPLYRKSVVRICIAE